MEYEIEISNMYGVMNDEAKKRISETIEPCINYIKNKLNEKSHLISDKNSFINLVKSIIEDLPILDIRFDSTYIIIQYSRSVNIKINQSVLQLHRSIKFDQILK